MLNLSFTGDCAHYRLQQTEAQTTLRACKWLQFTTEPSHQLPLVYTARRSVVQLLSCMRSNAYFLVNVSNQAISHRHRQIDPGTSDVKSSSIIKHRYLSTRRTVSVAACTAELALLSITFLEIFSATSFGWKTDFGKKNTLTNQWKVILIGLLWQMTGTLALARP